jgi:hypothetical protein
VKQIQFEILNLALLCLRKRNLVIFQNQKKGKSMGAFTGHEEVVLI